MEKENTTNESTKAADIPIKLNVDDLTAVTGGAMEGKGSGDKTYDPAICDAITEYTERCKECNRYRWLHTGDVLGHFCLQDRFRYGVHKPQPRWPSADDPFQLRPDSP